MKLQIHSTIFQTNNYDCMVLNVDETICFYMIAQEIKLYLKTSLFFSLLLKLTKTKTKTKTKT